MQRPYSNENELYKLIIETTNEGIWMIDENNVTNYVNKKMEDILGYSENEMLGTGLFDFMDAEGIEIATKNLERGKQGIEESHEFKFKSKDGRDVWTMINTSPITIDKIYRGALAMVTDISEAKSRETQIKDSYYSYISLFEDSPVPIWDENFSKIKLYIDNLKTEGVEDFRSYFRDHPNKLEECTSLLIINNINQAVVEINEADSKEQVLKGFRKLLTRNSAEYAIEQLVAIAEDKSSCEFDAELLTFKGNTRHVHLKWSVVKGHQKDYSRVYLSTTDVTKRIVDENLSLQNSNREKAVLLKEIHHRVKNNLQIISSLLNLQSHGIEDQKMKEIFNMSLNRVKSMATVHELLYQSNDFSGIDYREYLKKVVFSLIESMKGEENNIAVHLKVDNVRLNINTSIPLGLLINEIITNSLKHGILNNDTGDLYLEIYCEEHPNYILKIGDNGKGIPSSLDIESTDTLGLQLVTSLVEQLMGSIERSFEQQGTHYVIRFQELAQQSQE